MGKPIAVIEFLFGRQEAEEIFERKISELGIADEPNLEELVILLLSLGAEAVKKARDMGLLRELLLESEAFLGDSGKWDAESEVTDNWIT